MIHNWHERTVAADPTDAGALLDRVTGHDSPVWPAGLWSPMLFDRPLGIGAVGGHGPIRYTCTAYEPGRMVGFTFDPAIGLIGTHVLRVLPGAEPGTCVLRHDLSGVTRGSMRWRWPLVFRWLHDALVEDAFDHAATVLGVPPRERARWSPWVRFLRARFGAPRVNPV